MSSNGMGISPFEDDVAGDEESSDELETTQELEEFHREVIEPFREAGRNAGIKDLPS